jgi:hypothetical protein
MLYAESILVIASRRVRPEVAGPMAGSAKQSRALHECGLLRRHGASKTRVNALMAARNDKMALSSKSHLAQAGAKPRPMIRKLVTALILVPLAVVCISFAVANRQSVIISFDPFDRSDPALSFSVPLFALILVLVIGGVIVGGAAAWLRQRKWRWRARIAEAQARELRAENERLRRPEAASPPALPPSEHAPRLSIPPPLR